MTTLFSLLGFGFLAVGSFLVCFCFGGLYFFIKDVTDADPPFVFILVSILGGVGFVCVLWYSPIKLMII